VTGRRWVSVALLAAAGALVLWILPGDDKSEREPGLPPALVDAPDLEMTDAAVVQYAADGSRKYRLNASRIRHFDASGVTTLSNPEMFIDDPDDPPWDIRADSGVVEEVDTTSGAQEEQVDLDGDVQISQQREDGEFVRLSTEAIRYFPDRRYAETSRNVMIDTHVGRTMAAGMQGELDNGLFHLVSNDTQRVHTIVLKRQFK